VKVLDASIVDGRYRVALAEVDPPVARPGEVLVKVAASGLNRADLSQIAGHYPAPPGEPATLGLELSGVAVESGESVCALVAGGGHAEFAVVPVGQILPVPKGLALAQAAAIPEAFLTAYLNLVLEGGLARGGRALVHAGASGVGLAAIRMAKHLGAAVAATTRSAGKLPALGEAGADLAIDTSVEAFAAAIERAWGPDAVDVILDPVGAGTLPGDLDVLALEGRIVFLSALSGAKAELDLQRLMGKRGRIIGSMLRARTRDDKARIVGRFRSEVLPGFESGALRVTIDSTFPPERAAEAFERMRESRNVGKILIDWS
jgi:putative PIG3 family NAD(P)H quinone oxidoreductase